MAGGFVWERDIDNLTKEKEFSTRGRWRHIYLHAVQRAQKRYGIYLSARVYKWLCRRIRKKHRATQVWTFSGGRAVWALESVDDRYPLMFAVWDPKIERILTFFSPEWVNQLGRQRGV